MSLPEYYTDKELLDRIESLVWELRDNLNKQGNLPNYLYIKDLVDELKTLSAQTNLDVEQMFKYHNGE